MSGSSRGSKRPQGGQVVVLAEWRSAEVALVDQDYRALGAWSGPDRQLTFCAGEAGAFAMLRERSSTCASWGVVRTRGGVRLWNCVSLRDLGCFPSMADALGRLDDVAGRTATRAAAGGR